MEREYFLSSVYIIIRNNNNEILLQRRQGTKLWCGFLALPAGHIDKGENAYEALKREALEELDIKIDINDIIDTFVVNRKNEKIDSYFDIYFEIGSYTGDIKINETDKCSELVWCDIDNLPIDMITFEKEAIKNNINGVKFSVIKANENEKIKVKS